MQFRKTKNCIISTVRNPLKQHCTTHYIIFYLIICYFY